MTEQVSGVRDLSREDLAVCQEIYRRAALESDPHAYSSKQREVWASFADEEGFADFMMGDGGLVVEKDGAVCGFSSYEENGYIRCLYVSPDFQRSGVGGTLLSIMLNRLAGSPRIWTIASLFSRGLFARHGFTLTETEHKVHRGVAFERYIMDLTSR